MIPVQPLKNERSHGASGVAGGRGLSSRNCMVIHRFGANCVLPLGLVIWSLLALAISPLEGQEPGALVQGSAPAAPSSGTFVRDGGREQPGLASPAAARGEAGEGRGTANASVSPEMIARIEEETEQTRQRADSLRSRLESMNDRVLSLGLNDGNRMLLEENRRMLPSVSASRARIAWVQQEARRLNLEILRMGPEAGRAENNTGRPGAIPATVREPADPAPQELLSADADIGIMHRYSLALGHLAAEHNSLIVQVNLMERFLNRQLMWVANADPVSWTDLQKLLDGSRRLADSGPWLELLSRVTGRLRSNLWQLALVLALVVSVGLATDRLERAMRVKPVRPEVEPDLAETASQPGSDATIAERESGEREAASQAGRSVDSRRAA